MKKFETGCAFLALTATFVMCGIVSNRTWNHLFRWEQEIDWQLVLSCFCYIVVAAFLLWASGQQACLVWRRRKEITELTPKPGAETKEIIKAFLDKLRKAKDAGIPVSISDCREWEEEIHIPFRIPLKYPSVTIGFGLKVDELCQTIREQAYGPAFAKSRGEDVRKAFDKQHLPLPDKVDEAFDNGGRK